MKKIWILAAVMLILFSAAANAAYNVETDDSEYVSDEIYFSHLCTWGPIDADAIHLKKGKIIFYAGRENVPEKIETTVMPVNATEREVIFESADASIATVDADGVVTATGKEGNTVINITCGSAKARMKISVIKAVEGVTVTPAKMTLYADKPVTAQLEAVISPADATIHDVTWTSMDESIVHVDRDGLVYPNGVGTAEIYAETVDGGYKAKSVITVTTWEKRKEDIPVAYTDYDITTEKMTDIQMTAEPTVFTSDASPAYREEVLSFVNPENLISGYNKYQFLDLGIQNGIDASVLNSYLTGKGVLNGMGDVFKSAAEANNISEVYLVIHSCLESASGTSQLASGVEYNDTIVYNVFGIGAVDSDPVGGGAQYAYEQGWTTVEAAIEGGANWISNNYINNPNYRQNTLYKMRWNPDSPANHQYATDVEWASKQAKNMAVMFEAFPSASYRYEVPMYKGMKKLEIK